MRDRVSCQPTLSNHGRYADVLWWRHISVSQHAVCSIEGLNLFCCGEFRYLDARSRGIRLKHPFAEWGPSVRRAMFYCLLYYSTMAHGVASRRLAHWCVEHVPMIFFKLVPSPDSLLELTGTFRHFQSCQQCAVRLLGCRPWT